ncbi:MAG TPA: VWA domain-containing protein [Polyangiaceae bacterium]|nr:VWA domain-containing protein [Polyangiaceae bacterium]
MSALLVPFLYELRKRQLQVGTEEIVSLAKGMALGLHGSTLDGFYRLSRSLLVHRESDLDRFDQAFAAHFRGIDTQTVATRDVLEGLLRGASSGTDDGGVLDPDELPEWLREMLDGARENDSDAARTREDPENGIGRRGPRPPRLPLGGDAASSGRERALGMADARRYRRYRSDLVLDVRQIELALRRLRSFSRDGREDELDVDGTVDRTARAFGELEVVLRPPRKSNVRLVLFMDVGGSMEPFATLCSQLFSAAKRASNLRELRSYYFHNVPYGRVFSTDGYMTPLELPELFEQVNERYKLVVVGDAAMAPGEMLSVGPWGSSWRRPGGSPMRGFDWLVTLADRFDRAVWLNPDPPSYWVGGTAQVISQVFHMHPLTLDGLAEAVSFLAKDGPAKLPPFTGNPRNAL